MQAHQSNSQHAADRLLAAVERKAAPVCVGIDPVIERLPRPLTPGDADPSTLARAIGDFSRGVLEAVAEHVPCVKFQSACFERYGWQGVRVLEELIGGAHRLEMQVILDAKRGDIGISAEHYAAAAFDGPQPADWLTVNAYLGDDALKPFMTPGHGAFALVRTSNAGSDGLQALKLADDETVAEAVARMIASLGTADVGATGYSSLGAVVGATKQREIARLRELMPQQIFLVPGYGAQGGSAEDVKACFRNGAGAIITASRSVIYAFEHDAESWQRSIAEASAAFADEIGRVAGLR